MCSNGGEQSLLWWLWIRAGPTGFSVAIAGIKAIKIKLGGTLAMNENWILTKALIWSVCCV